MGKGVSWIVERRVTFHGGSHVAFLELHCWTGPVYTRKLSLYLTTSAAGLLERDRPDHTYLRADVVNRYHVAALSRATGRWMARAYRLIWSRYMRGPRLPCPVSSAPFRSSPPNAENAMTVHYMRVRSQVSLPGFNRPDYEERASGEKRGAGL